MPTLLLLLPTALAGAKPDEPAMTSPESLPVRVAPDPSAGLRGWTAAGAAFRVLGPAEGRGCPAGWVQVEAGGFLCTDRATPTRIRCAYRPRDEIRDTAGIVDHP